jgi:sarcosine oxidase subunit alpha
MATKLGAMDNVRVMTRTTVTGAYDQGTFGALERVAKHRARGGDAPRECFWRIVAKRSVLCAGALERGIAFPNNDRPGVMQASAVRAYVNRWGVAAGQRVAVYGNNDDAHRTVQDLQDAGVEVVALIDPRGSVSVAGVACIRGAVTGTKGRLGLEQICVDGRWIDCDVLAISGGWNPSVHLTCHMNGRPVWNDSILSFGPSEGAIPGMSVAGAADGNFAMDACLGTGAVAGAEAAETLGFKAVAVDVPESDVGIYAIEPLWSVEGKGRKWLDYQNDVTVKDVAQSAREGFKSVEHMKRYTTQGMATDQGKNSNVAALAVLADATGRGIPETGVTTFRPPYVPVSIGAIGAGAQGKGFAPERLMTSHVASVARGAPMIEAGLWYRPSYFSQAGETTWRESCDREVGYVRNTVGVCDVSTLGKIDVQGPDAAAFLDFLYVNLMSSLKIGRVRYGLMLREDGHVMDDGTCARLGETHFVVTTTTAAAGLVMRHMEFVAQALRPDLDVQFASVTEQWAQFAVAGPASKALIELVVDVMPALPFMGCDEVGVAGAMGRLFRISFSGEHAYEIAVPARFGDALFRLLVAQAEMLGGGAYGMEALNVLRIEKGFITHAEIHGRVTAFDVGMAGMISPKKDCIGKVMAARQGLVNDRQEMVGLRSVCGGRLTAGAHLFGRDDAAVATLDQGYVTSVCYSPTLGCDLGQGFLLNGRARSGEVIRLVDALRGVETLCEVCDPVFYDSDGGRMRG